MKCLKCLRFLKLFNFSIFFVVACLLSVPLLAMESKAQKNTSHQVVFIMLGAPGAGKETQAVRLSDQFGIPQVSTGELFRENIRNQTPLGQKAKTYMDKGLLTPDEMVLDM